jgi:hypothetical protein
MVHTSTIQGVVNATVGETIKQTAKDIGAWIGRAWTTSINFVKDTAIAIAHFVADFFKNFPQRIRSGFGIGGILAIGGTATLITACCLNKDENAHKVPRIILIIASAALFFLSAAFMFGFGKNTVCFSRAPVVV